VKFLGMSAYVLVSRAQVPMLQVETFAADYRKFTYDRIPPELSESLDRGEVDNSFLFSLNVIELRLPLMDAVSGWLFRPCLHRMLRGWLTVDAWKKSLRM
jgi:hypothetical protein